MAIQLLAMTSLNPDAESALNAYLNVVGPLMESAGAKIVSRFELSENIAGSSEFQFVTVVEYPDEASVKTVFESEEYRSLAKVKKLAFSKYQVNVTKSI